MKIQKIIIMLVILSMYLTGCNRQTPDQIVTKGNEYLYKGQIDLAIAEYTNAIKMNPKFTMAYVKRGEAFQKKYDYGLAIKDFSAAIEIDPGFATAYVQRARAYATIGQYDRAMTDINKAKEINPSLGTMLQYLIDQINRWKEQEKEEQSTESPHFVVPSR